MNAVVDFVIQLNKHSRSPSGIGTEQFVTILGYDDGTYAFLDADDWLYPVRVNASDAVDGLRTVVDHLSNRVPDIHTSEHVQRSHSLHQALVTIYHDPDDEHLEDVNVWIAAHGPSRDFFFSLTAEKSKMSSLAAFFEAMVAWNTSRINKRN